jgi:hypothetical protein
MIRALIEHEVRAGKKPATVRRYIATIGRAHIGTGLLNPCSGEAVLLALKKNGRQTSARQAHALDWDKIKQLARETQGSREGDARKFRTGASADADCLTQRYSAMVKTFSFHRTDGKTVPGYLGEVTHAAGGARR